MTSKYKETVAGSRSPVSAKATQARSKAEKERDFKLSPIMVIIAALTAFAAIASGVTAVFQYISDTPQFHLESYDGEIRLYPIGGRPYELETLTMTTCDARYAGGQSNQTFIKGGHDFFLVTGTERNSHFHTTLYLGPFVESSCRDKNRTLEEMRLRVYYTIEVIGLFNRKSVRTVLWPGEVTDPDRQYLLENET